MTNCFDAITNAAPDELYRVYQVPEASEEAANLTVLFS
jgi:hypothetical protein